MQIGAGQSTGATGSSAGSRGGPLEGGPRRAMSFRAIRKGAARATGMRGVFSGKYKTKEAPREDDILKLLGAYGLGHLSGAFRDFGILTIDDM